MIHVIPAQASVHGLVFAFFCPFFSSAASLLAKPKFTEHTRFGNGRSSFLISATIASYGKTSAHWL
jgi:hypothetical protein